MCQQVIFPQLNQRVTVVKLTQSILINSSEDGTIDGTGRPQKTGNQVRPPISAWIKSVIFLYVIRSRQRVLSILTANHDSYLLLGQSSLVYVYYEKVILFLFTELGLEESSAG